VQLAWGNFQGEFSVFRSYATLFRIRQVAIGHIRDGVSPPTTRCTRLVEKFERDEIASSVLKN